MEDNAFLESFRSLWKDKFLDLKYTYRNFKFINEVQSNVFLESSRKNYIINNLFLETREIYLSKKFYYKWRRFILNKKKSTNHLDLELNPLDKKNNVYVFDFINNRKYTFTQKEIKKVIENSLFCSFNYEPEPKPMPIKNPYTNLEMTIYQLKDIDIQLEDSLFIWDCYKNNNWNLKKMLIYHLPYLQLKCIEYYVLSLDKEELRYYLEDIVKFINNGSYDNRKICNKCLKDERRYKEKNVIRIIIEWIEFLKLKRNIQEIKFTIDKLYNVFNSNCSIHNKKTIKKKSAKELFLFPTTNININDNKSIFHFNSNYIDIKPQIKVNLNVDTDTDQIKIKLIDNTNNNYDTNNKNIITKNTFNFSNEFVFTKFNTINKKTIGVLLNTIEITGEIKVFLYEKLEFNFNPAIENECKTI